MWTTLPNLEIIHQTRSKMRGMYHILDCSFEMWAGTIHWPGYRLAASTPLSMDQGIRKAILSWHHRLIFAHCSYKKCTNDRFIITGLRFATCMVTLAPLTFVRLATVLICGHRWTIIFWRGNIKKRSWWEVTAPLPLLYSLQALTAIEVSDMKGLVGMMKPMFSAHCCSRSASPLSLQEPRPCLNEHN